MNIVISPIFKLELQDEYGPEDMSEYKMEMLKDGKWVKIKTQKLEPYVQLRFVKREK